MTNESGVTSQCSLGHPCQGARSQRLWSAHFLSATNAATSLTYVACDTKSDAHSRSRRALTDDRRGLVKALQRGHVRVRDPLVHLDLVLLAGAADPLQNSLHEPPRSNVTFSHRLESGQDFENCERRSIDRLTVTPLAQRVKVVSQSLRGSWCS